MNRTPMQRERSDLGMLLQQLMAHRGFVLRRAAREALAGLLTRIPGGSGLAKRLTAGPGAEASVWATLSQAWARRSHAPVPARAAASGEDLEVEARLVLDAAAGSPHVGESIDALLAVGNAALAAKRLELARELLERAARLDGGRPGVLLALGQLELAEDRLAAARPALERSRALDPTCVASWVALGDAWQSEDPSRARDCWWRALEREPQLDSVVIQLERSMLEARADARSVSVSVMDSAGADAQSLEVGDEIEIQLEVRAEAGNASLYVLEPFGAGLECSPRRRIALDVGTTQISLHVKANRPDTVNGGRPWRLELAAVGAQAVARAHIELAVPEREPGELYHLITEDHELYDERPTTSPSDARTTLLDKSELAQSIAERHGRNWTHVVDVGSLAFTRWAATHSGSSAWHQVDEACREHLCDAVARGHDLALHLHAFHDPEHEDFCHSFDAAQDCVTTDRSFFEQPLSKRGFWNRAYPVIGDVDQPGTRAHASWHGIGLLESLGRLGDPRFGVALFRAGGFDFGSSPQELDRSLALLRSLGILADSDVPKPRFYHRTPSPTVYPVSGDPHSPELRPARMRVLEIRPEYNIEGDYLSNLAVLNRYAERRVSESQDDEAIAPGIHIVCCMTHDKFINFRMGRRWDSLDPEYEDWAVIDAHLQHLKEAMPQLRPATTREAVLAWYDRYGPELIAWRDEEVVVAAAPDRTCESFRYPLRLLGRGIQASPERPQPVVVRAPAWLQGRIRDAWIERAGERWPAEKLAAGPPAWEFKVEDRSADFELVVQAEAGDGIVVEATGADRVKLSSRHGYRRATLELPAELSPDGRTHRLQGVALERNEDAYVGEVQLG